MPRYRLRLWIGLLALASGMVLWLFGLGAATETRWYALLGVGTALGLGGTLLVYDSASALRVLRKRQARARGRLAEARLVR